MYIIRDKDGNKIKQSSSLVGIRRYTGGKWRPKNLTIRVISVSSLLSGEAKLLILYSNDASFETNFPSLGVLKNWLRSWRGAYNTPLLIDGQEQGKVSYKNPALQEYKNGG